jgi:hypothetical protein
MFRPTWPFSGDIFCEQNIWEDVNNTETYEKKRDLSFTRRMVYKIIMYNKFVVTWRSESIFLFLCALTKLWTATISFVMLVCPSTRNNSAPNVRIVMKLDIWGFFFENLSWKLKFRQNPTIITDILQEGFPHLWQHIAKFFFKWEIFWTEVENHGGYEIMSKNMLEPEGPQMTSQYDAYDLHAG